MPDIDDGLYRDRGTVEYDTDTNTSTITLPYYPPSTTVLVRADTMEIVQWTRVPDTNSVEVVGDMTAVPIYAGVPYTQRYRFGPAMLRKQTQTGGLGAVRTGRLQVLRWCVTYSVSGPFDLEVRRSYRAVASKRITPRRLATALNNSPVSGKATCLVQSRNETCRVDIVNAMHWPTWFQSASWSGDYTRDDQLI
jgi:hypothetical protein